MDLRTAHKSIRWRARTLVIVLTTSMVAIAIGTAEFVRAPPAAQPKATQPRAVVPGPETRPAAVESQQAQPIFSPWTKVCFKGQEAGAVQVCFTGKNGWLEALAMVSVVLIEPEGGANKTLRVTLPLGVRLPEGTRVIVDQGQPLTAPYIVCLANGCMADYEASRELIASMEKGHGLVVEGANRQDQAISMVLPLDDFGKARDGPPTDLKVFQEQLKKLQDDVQKRAEGSREKLEGLRPSP